MSRRGPFRESDDRQLRAELRHAHNAIRLIYIVVMAVALGRALELLFEAPVGDPARTFSMFPIEEVAVFVVFLITISRFFLGDIRHLDHTYLTPLESDDAIAARLDQQVRPLNLFIDFYLLLIHGVLFYYLATSIQATTHFFLVFTILLIVNVGWLSITSTVGTTDIPFAEAYRLYREAGVRESLVSLPVELRWVTNNTVTAIVLGVLFLLAPFTSFPIWIGFVIVGIANSVVAFWLNWEFYFPLFSQSEER